MEVGAGPLTPPTPPTVCLHSSSTARAKFGRIEVVAHNAGYSTFGEVEAVWDEVNWAVFEMNFLGATNVTHTAVRVFCERNLTGADGRLLNFSLISWI